MEAFRAYSFGTAGWLTLQALPLLLTPKLIVSMLAADPPRAATDLEVYLARALALALLALAGLTVLLTGSVPLGPDHNNENENDAAGTAKDPYAYPALVVTTGCHALGAFHLYTQLTGGWSFGFGAGLLGSAGLFGLGVWVALFGGEKGRISKTTGADKRTANFPFENKESAREKKREGKGEGKRRSVARTSSSRNV